MIASHEFDLAHACSLWTISSKANVTLINVSENRTYLITNADGTRAVLREHRPDYHSLLAIESELMWLEALHRDCDISVPVVIRGCDGSAIQTVECHDGESLRHLVMFEFMEGLEPVDDSGMLEHFEALGGIAARLHLHAMQWTQPATFIRRQWNADAVLGEHAAWGHWHAGPGIDDSNQSILWSLETVLRKRLTQFGMGNNVYGLIHADMRRANLLLSNDTTHVIDFDDCGFSWYLYDFATAVSFIEDHPQMGDLKANWLQGYRRHRSLSEDDERELDTFVLFRRLALLGWMGTHAEVDIVKLLSPTFAQGTALLAQRYLNEFEPKS